MRIKPKTITSKIVLIFIFLIIVAGITNSIALIWGLNRYSEKQFLEHKNEINEQVKQQLQEHVEVAIQLAKAAFENAKNPKHLAKQYGPQLESVIDLAETTISDLEHQYEIGKISLKEAQKQAIQRIKAMRFNNDIGYIWINDTSYPIPKMIMHPVLSELDGKILDSPKFNCALGEKKNLFVAASETAKLRGEGFIDYLWPRPNSVNEKELKQKLSYVRLYKKWNWILGTGIYTDDTINAAKESTLAQLRKFRWDNDVGYIWITDIALPIPRMLMHPVQPELEGQILNDPKYIIKSTDKNIFASAVELALAQNQGYIYYDWFQSQNNDTRPKVAFIKRFEPFDWVIGTGAYLDELQSVIEQKKKALRTELFEQVFWMFTIMILAIVLYLIIGSKIIHRMISKRLKTVTTVANRISKGEIPEPISTHSNDEIGLLTQAFNNVILTSKEIVKQAQTISTGQFDISISPRSEKDELGYALINMTESLKAIHEEKRKDSWFKTGITDLNHTIRGEQDINTLSSKSINFICEYLGALAGSLYFMEDDEQLHLRGRYAHSNVQDQQTFSLGEGLVGKVAKDLKAIVINDIPENSIIISSSIIHAKPKSLALIPLLREGQIVGVLEVASMKPIDPQIGYFLQAIGESLGIAFYSAFAIKKVNDLFEKTQQQSFQLIEQQQELEQSNRELTERTLLLEKRTRELQEHREELEQTNEELSEQARLVEIHKQQKK